MKTINFTKMVASGNDFVVIDAGSVPGIPRLSCFAKSACDRKFGIGADGLLLIGRSRKADIRMRIFNADGSEAEMCGNGARCAAFYAAAHRISSKTGKLSIETLAGIIFAEAKKDNIRIKLTDPRDIRLGIPLHLGNRSIKVNFVNTGVPHAVIFTEGLDKIMINGISRSIRHHKVFAPYGTNVDFIEPIDRSSFKIRTYERGVEDETLACGTGSVASAIIFALKIGKLSGVKVHTKSKEVLKVYFDQQGMEFGNVWLEGKARIVYGGKYYV